jgi:hypothetical protein
MRSSPVDAASIDAAIKEAEDACKTGDAAEWCVQALSAGLRAGFGPARAPGAPASAHSASQVACLRSGGPARRGEVYPTPANVLEVEDCPAAAGPCPPRAPSAGTGSAACALGRERLRAPSRTDLRASLSHPPRPHPAAPLRGTPSRSSTPRARTPRPPPRPTPRRPTPWSSSAPTVRRAGRFMLALYARARPLRLAPLPPPALLTRRLPLPFPFADPSADECRVYED